MPSNSEQTPKRPRGRPRKNPVPQAKAPQAKAPEYQMKQTDRITHLREKPPIEVVGDGEFKPQPQLEVVNAPKRGPEPLPLPPPASHGKKWVFNRLPEPYEALFNSQPILFEPHSFREIDAMVAPHIVAWSIIQLPSSGPPVRALALEGKKQFGVPLGGPRPVEMIDRSENDNPTGRGTGGVPTKAKIIHI